MKINNTVKLIISLIIPKLAGGLGSFFTIGSVKDWYPVLVKPAAWLLVPYILWVSFAAYLNYAIWILN